MIILSEKDLAEANLYGQRLKKIVPYFGYGTASIWLWVLLQAHCYSKCRFFIAMFDSAFFVF